MVEGLRSRSSRPRPQWPSLASRSSHGFPCCFQPEALRGTSRLPTPRQPGSPRPLTSAAGPAQPAAALSLRVRELLYPGSGPLSPRAPPPLDSVARLPWPPQPAVSKSCQPQNPRGHIWLCFALILACRHHLTNKKRRSAATPPSPPPNSPLLRDSLPETTHGQVPAEPGAQHLERGSPVEGTLHSFLPSPAA